MSGSGDLRLPKLLSVVLLGLVNPELRIHWCVQIWGVTRLILAVMPTTVRSGPESKPQVGQPPLWGHPCPFPDPSVMSDLNLCDQANQILRSEQCGNLWKCRTRVGSILASFKLIYLSKEASAGKEVDFLGSNCRFTSLKGMIRHFIFTPGRIHLGATHLLCMSMKDPVRFP